MIDDDPRLQPGAYITEGVKLYRRASEQLQPNGLTQFSTPTEMVYNGGDRSLSQHRRCSVNALAARP
jgi:hypothetical protein